MNADILSHYTVAQKVAVSLLYEVAKRHLGTSGGNTAARLLLSLYNGARFPLDPTYLRLLDDTNFEAAMTVIRMDARSTWVEVHVLIDALLHRSRGTGAEFEHWAYDLRLKGRCKKDELPALPRAVMEGGGA